MDIHPKTIDWLLAGPAWIAYRARLDLLGEGEASAAAAAARQAMLADPQVNGLIAALNGWPEPPLKSHKTAGHPLHLLAFAAGLGLRPGDPGMDQVIERVLAHPSAEGVPQILMEISPAFGGSGRPEYTWMLCDAPLILFALARMGLGGDERVRRAYEPLLALARPNGWPCAASPGLGRWRGPGRREDPCPYTNLLMLKAIAEQPDLRDCPEARAGAETALQLWQQSRERSPYLFKMGDDFRRLKAPNVWYDLLHVLEVLSRFPWLRGDPRLAEMAALAASRADADGRYTPESVWMAWKDWEFGQKKAPSRWLTLQMLSIQARING
jgi:hypothetical protein